MTGIPVNLHVHNAISVSESHLGCYGYDSFVSNVTRGFHDYQVSVFTIAILGWHP